MTLYLFLATTFVLRFLLTEWVFGGFYRSAGGLGRPAMRQCIVMAVFWLHLVAVEDVSSRMESSVESNLDKGHLVAFYIWMKLGSLMGVLSSLVAWILMLKAVFSLLGPYDLVTLIVVVIVLVNIVLFFCALWRLLVFVKELSLVVRIYAKIPDVENLIDFASDDCDDEDTAKDS
ncbi:hypothetical protein HDU84_001640 [Entophlyctis sp. JEL0112]|nr:hypothetical protein HDU84_001640 [Entophlyctis sp. JEL0112]